MDIPDLLAALFPLGPQPDGRLAGEQDHRILEQRVVDLAVDAVRGCRWASLTQLRGRHLQTTASTALVVVGADATQYWLEEGPSLDAIWAEDSYQVRDTSTETRWPRWSRAVHAWGVGSVLAVRLATPTCKVGALNFYAGKPRAFDGHNVLDARRVADRAAGALERSHELNPLQKTLETRHVIEVAQEILMAGNPRLTRTDAVRVLRHTAESSAVGLLAIAEAVIARDNAARLTLQGTEDAGAGGRLSTGDGEARHRDTGRPARS